MKKQFTFILSILLSIVVQSCKNTKETDLNNAPKNVEITYSLPNFEEISDEQEQNISIEPDNNYPKTGNKIEEFVPKTSNYEVQYEAEGDLNNDGLADIAVVLKHKKSKISKRPMLILLQNQDRSYSLSKVSNIAMPSEYNEYDYKLYDTEDIGIDKGELNINLYSIGPSGNIFSSFKYAQNDFILNFLEAHYGGAGGRSALFYDFNKGEITTVDTNTMEEDEPTTSETTKAKSKRYFFENTSLTEFFNDSN